MNYKEFKQNFQNKINNFPLFFAFSNEQFAEGIKKLNITDKTKLRAIGAGGFMLKSNKKDFDLLFKTNEEELKNNLNNYDFAFSAFNYELGNHEYGYTGDTYEAIEALNLTYEEIQENPVLKKALNSACKKQNEWYAIHG